jgi:hypothetical protein
VSLKIRYGGFFFICSFISLLLIVTLFAKDYLPILSKFNISIHTLRYVLFSVLITNILSIVLVTIIISQVASFGTGMGFLVLITNSSLLSPIVNCAYIRKYLNSIKV